MKRIVRLLVVLVLVVAILLGVGYAIPARHVFTRTVALKQTPDAIFSALADLSNMPSWNHGMKKVEMLPPIDGKEASRQTLEGNMVMTVVTTESVSPTHLVRTIGPGQGPFTGSWTYNIIPSPDGTLVALTEDSTVDNPIFRLMVQVFGKAKHVDQHLVDLGKHFNETVSPK